MKGWPLCKASSFVSHEIRWYNKRISMKSYSIPRYFSWMKNCKLNLPTKKKKKNETKMCFPQIPCKFCEPKWFPVNLVNWSEHLDSLQQLETVFIKSFKVHAILADSYVFFWYLCDRNLSTAQKPEKLWHISDGKD